MGYASHGVGGPILFTGVYRQGAPVYPAAGSTLTIVGGWENGSVLSPTSRTNLFLESQTIGTSPWTFSSEGFTANAGVAPDGTNTADRLTPVAADDFHSARQGIAVGAGVAALASIWVKADGYRKVGLREGNTTGAYAAFDLSAGTKLAEGTGGTGSIVNAGNEWYRITLAFTTGATTRIDLITLPDSYTSGSVTDSWTADGIKSILAWGAQLETGSVASRYTATTTTAASETDYSYDQPSGLITLTRALASDASWMTFGTSACLRTSSSTIWQVGASSTV